MLSNYSDKRFIEDRPSSSFFSSEKKTHEHIDPNIPITVREFREGDEEGIAYLIYKNYGHSYIKDLFHYPQKILEYHSQKSYLIAAEAEGRVIGHFAFMLIPDSTIAKIRIDGYSKDFKHQFRHLVSQLKSKHCDMIYVDISLENIPQIDKAVKVINKKAFSAAGLFSSPMNRQII